MILLTSHIAAQILLGIWRRKQSHAKYLPLLYNEYNIRGILQTYDSVPLRQS